MPQLSSGWIASTIVAIVFVILYPIALGVIANRRLKVSWKYFLFGVAIFFVFQVISRVPLVTVAGVVLAKPLRDSAVFRWTWLGVLVLTAGLFEEVGRYVGYRVFMRREEKTWSKAVMYGIGHGGLESILLVGVSTAATLVGLMTLSSLPQSSIPAAQRATAVAQLSAIAAQPAWLPLLAAWERLWTLPVHIALSVIVLQVFRRNNIGWLWLAILGHALVDGVSVGLAQALPKGVGTDVLVEIIVAIFGVIALWIIWRLRERSDMVVGEATAAPAATGGMPGGMAGTPETGAAQGA